MKDSIDNPISETPDMSDSDTDYTEAEQTFGDMLVDVDPAERLATLAELQRRLDDQRAVDEYHGFPTTPQPVKGGSTDRFGDYLRSKGRAGMPAETRIEQE